MQTKCHNWTISFSGITTFLWVFPPITTKFVYQVVQVPLLGYILCMLFLLLILYLLILFTLAVVFAQLYDTVNNQELKILYGLFVGVKNPSRLLLLLCSEKKQDIVDFCCYNDTGMKDKYQYVQTIDISSINFDMYTILEYLKNVNKLFYIM